MAAAFQSRSVAYHQIRFNFYCDNMPIDGISTLDGDQITRIKTSARNVGSLKSADEQEVDFQSAVLMKEICLDFATVLNRLQLVSTGKALPHPDC